ncbi:autotransporter outer membrane beta-barrel domain-containing protein [uncultured Phascolarctobacterium sp.]|uniref:autotransporter outer membrane beta-barrel domain-containing protein n=1 Tax=uncultured Phascolarctobacterium sp. TaxID=512296 RepID=UPI00260E6143|nr:autotransporter outer membrane beta-barrel domain-containing protein [uncultured Phascolarctobacterium sp.]
MNGGAVNFDHAVDIYGSATKSGVYGIYTTGTGSSIHAKDKVVIETVGGTTNRGIQVSGGGNALFENSLIVKTSGDSGSNYGIFVSSGGTLKADGDLQLAVSGAYAQAGLLVDGANSVVQINGRADIDFVTDSASFAVNAWNQGKIDFNGAVFINANSIREEHLNKAVIAVMENGTVNINQSGGKQVVIKGGISASNGNLNLTLDRSDSVLEGYILSNGSSNTALKLSNASAWRLSNMLPSRVGKVELSSDATIDMTFGGMSATELSIGDYSGTGGNFILYTDLASEADGDKVVITNAAAGTTYVQVKDASLTNGSVVTGNKNLLLITDASKNAAFVGKKLNAGGLWDVTPTIENGLKVTLNDGTQGTEEQWYLTKIAKAVNNDTGVLLNAADNSYALWRNSNDTLRKRLGELRYRANKNDGDGIWARYTGGKFGSSGFDGSYNMYQLGYDKADNAKSTYGFAVESGTGHADYSFGSGKDKLWAGSLYGTWQGGQGNYTDVVARVGQFDTDINSYGDYPDKANSKNHAYSLSVEYGKTIELSEAHGTFIEPQVQFIMGRLGSSSYTTDRGNNVYLSGVNSYIGRLGIVAGQKMSDGNDIYLKANLLHEFGGDRDIYMRAANGEILSDSRDYGDTWFELGLGGNVKLSNNSHFYGDIERSFGADIQKKWQINAGVRWTF